ncbi:MAG: FG-GAP-like repeat-containing protein, partial [bacterium]
MKTRSVFLGLAVLLLGSMNLFASGVGDVEIRLNGCSNMAFIGETNILEIWIANDDLLDGMTIGFEISIGRNFSFNPTYGNHGYVNEEGDAVGAWSTPGLVVTPDFNNISPEKVFLVGAALTSGQLPVHTTHSLCYTLEFTIPAGQQPLAGGISIDNIVQMPLFEWYFDDSGGKYPPDFQGQANSSTTLPNAPPVTFDIVDLCWAAGDVNNDGINLGTADYVALQGYLHMCGQMPAFLYKCDLYGDGIIDDLDLEVFLAYLTYGMSAFGEYCGYPVPTRCDCIAHKSPCVTTTDPPDNAIGVPKASNVYVTFDSDLDPACMVNTSFIICGKQSLWHQNVAYSYNGGTYTVTCDPANTFNPGEEVIVNLPANRYWSPQGIETGKFYQWDFIVSTTKGNGNYAPGVMNYTGGDVSDLVTADFDGDGDLDIVTVCEDCDSISVIFNDGKGQFALTRGVYPVGYSGASNNKPAGLVAADFDQDGDFDVVVARGGDDIDSSAFVLMENDGSGAFASTGLQPLVVDGLSHSTPSILTGDFNGDGYFDLVAAIGDYAVDSAAMLYFENNGEGVFNSKTRGVYPVGYKGSSTNRPAGLVAADFDEDGYPDPGIILGNYDVDSAAFYGFRNNGSAVFYPTGVYPVGYKGTSTNHPSGLVADANGDGHGDIIMVMNNYDLGEAAVSVFDGLGDGTYSAAGVYPVGYSGASNNKPAGIIADVDADGDLDIVAHFGDIDSICVLHNNGDGAFALTRGVYPVGYSGASNNKPAGLVAGDFNGDGAIDLAVSCPVVDSVAIMFNEVPYLCGDASGDGIANITDAVYLIQYIFN